MPELPEICDYVRVLEGLVQGEVVSGTMVKSPFLIRSVEPPISQAHGLRVQEIRRIGKRIVLGLEGDLFLVIHLMVNGRLKWSEKRLMPKSRNDLLAIHFEKGTLVFTESGSKKRASLYVVKGETALADHDPGGLEVLDATLEDFRGPLTAENHTLKRTLTDPRLFSGIGNKYSDEILHAAGLSPVKWTSRLTDDEVERLYEATRQVLGERVEKIAAKTDLKFPAESRTGMKVYGRDRKPCPDCGTEIQRIKYSERSTYYCPRCQTDGKVLADRSLSRMLKDDWPKTIEEFEERMRS